MSKWIEEFPWRVATVPTAAAAARRSSNGSGVTRGEAVPITAPPAASAVARESAVEPTAINQAQAAAPQTSTVLTICGVKRMSVITKFRPSSAAPAASGRIAF